MRNRIRRHLWLWSISAVLILGALTLALAQAGGRLFVVNTLSESLSIIDIAADTTLGSIPLGSHGYRVAFSPNGGLAYVTASAEIQKAKAAKAGVPSSRLLIVDLARQKVTGEIPLDISPMANVHVHPNGRQAFVTTAGPTGARNIERGRVLLVDLPHRKVAKTVDIGLNPLDSVMTPNGKQLFTADWGSRSISVVDIEGGRLLDTLPLGVSAARTLAMQPDGARIYAALETPIIAYNVQSNTGLFNNNMTQVSTQNALPVAAGTTVAEIDTKTRKITQFPVPEIGSVIALAVTPNGDRLYLYGTAAAPPIEQNANRNETQMRQQPQQVVRFADTYTLFAVDLAKKQVAQRLGSFGYLSALAVSPDGKKLYLIGTPGDPAREAVVQQRVNDRVQRAANDTNIAKAGNGSSHSKGGPTPAASTDTVTGILDDLSELPKTLTVLDTATGRRLKTLPLGSLPQGYGVTK
ncbi:MAG: YncE family protein [Armatimonadota bacterium]